MRRAPWLLLAVLVLLGLQPVPLVAPVAARAAGRDRAEWVWPLAGQPSVARRFDPPAQRWVSGHRGVDLLAPAGSRVRAAGPGRVSFAGSLAGRGVVTVTHRDGTRTTYQPVLSSVRVGQGVRIGETLGRLAGPGHCAPSTCLHWGRLRGEVYLDPLALVGAGPVRLLPLWGGSPPTGRSGLDAVQATNPRPADRPATGPAGAPVSPRWRTAAATGTLLVPVLLAAAALARRRTPP